jgi:hypothetical protein
MAPLPESPPRQQAAPVIHESPVHAKKVHSSRSYQNDQLVDARLVVLEELGPEVPQVTLDTFMDFLAPPKPDFDIEATMDLLNSRGVFSPSGRWKEFTKEPKDQSGGEDKVFKPMTHIFDSVVDAIISTPNSRLTADNCLIDFLQNPTIAPTSSERRNTAKPDGYFLLKDRSDKNTISWADVVLSCEYKLKGRREDLDDVSASH